MARMIPEIEPDSITNPGERDVYRAMRDQLPAEWVVRYHLPACFLDGLELQESEADFIVVVPGLGLMFVEVKSSEGFDCENGQWFRVSRAGERFPSKNPFFQASRTKHLVVDRIAKKLGHDGKAEFPGLYGHCVAYPRARLVGRLCPSQVPAVILVYRDMDRLRSKLEESMALWGPSSVAARFTPRVQRDVVDFLEDECRLKPVLAADVDDDEGCITELTEQQWKGFRKLLESRKVTVTGTAGSGKTMLALWTAQALVERTGDGLGNPGRVLFLCYNRILARWLEAKYATNAGFGVRSFFSLCRSHLSKPGMSFSVPTDADDQHLFWTQQAPIDLARALHDTEAKAKYDAVVIDEAQDFHKDWWFAIEYLLKDPAHGHLYLFLDPRQQGVYGKDVGYPTQEMAFINLDENCRNTKKIAGYCGQVVGCDIPSFAQSPIGVVPDILHAISDPGARAAAVRRVLKQLLHEGFKPSRIAILSPWKSTNSASSLGSICAVDQIPIVQHENDLGLWLDGKAIWASTVKSFKGLESDCIVLVDIPQIGDPALGVSDLYVAVSRAKHRLIILPLSESAESELKAFCLSLRQPGTG